MTEIKDLIYYLSLPYTTVLRRDEDGDVVARIEELSGCISHGEDEAAALANLNSVKQMWLEDALTAGEDIPEPQEPEPLPSGKWVQRVPKSLHQRLVKMARQEGVSLNQLVTQILSEGCGTRKIQSAIEGVIANCIQQVYRTGPDVDWEFDPFNWHGQWSVDHSPTTPTRIKDVQKLIPQLEMGLKNASEFTEGCALARVR